MNSVNIIGRLARDPEVRQTDGGMAVGRFSVAIDRGKDKNGENKGADFPNVVCFGKIAELVDRYLRKGRLVGIQGRIQTGSYTNKDGQKVYTTDIVADRVQFLDRGDDVDNSEHAGSGKSTSNKPSAYEGFSQIDDSDIPF